MVGRRRPLEEPPLPLPRVVLLFGVSERERIESSMATAVEGKGAVPDTPLLSAVVKRLFELPTAKTFASNGLPVQWPAGFDFTADGLSAQVPAAVLWAASHLVPHAAPSRA